MRILLLEDCPSRSLVLEQLGKRAFSVQSRKLYEDEQGTEEYRQLQLTES